MSSADHKLAPAPSDDQEPKSSEGWSWFRKSLNPFRIATLRGLGVLLPPLLTIIFFFWAWNTIERAVLRPVESAARYLIYVSINDTHLNKEIQQRINEDDGERLQIIKGREIFIAENGQPYCLVVNEWLPCDIVDSVNQSRLDDPPTTARGYYNTYINQKYLRRHLVIPAFLAAFVAFLYLTGKLLAAGVGRILYRSFEALINRVPIIRNVYSSVKQVTDFAFNETEIQFNRVVAVEYPRKGIWSIGFVTGESLGDIRKAAGEPMLSVLMPTSPMPATGFTISIPKSETIDLNLTIDQAIQFCVSCGVVIPPHQQSRATLEGQVRQRLNELAQQTAPSQPGIPSDPTESAG